MNVLLITVILHVKNLARTHVVTHELMARFEG